MSGKTVSAIMMFLLVIGTLTLAFRIQIVRADGGAITISTDGSITPATAPIYSADNITYSLTSNITAATDGIVIERDNIVLEGAGYVLQGPGVWTGISLSGRTNVTIQHIEIQAFDEEILLWNSVNNNVLGNSITDSNGYGILLYGSSNNSISGNNIEMSTTAVPEPEIGGSGITILSSNYTMVTENTIENTFGGIDLQDSSLTNISANTLKNNYYGIGVVDSNYSSISGNTLASGKTGIDLERCSNIIVSANNITENEFDGITLYPGAVSNVLYMNNIVSNILGFLLWNASSNSIYGNELVHNSLQVDIITSDNNSWDNGYPIAGNYWSDYSGKDLYGGPNQNITGSDGIGDTPYIIDANNIDHYPLMQPLVPYYEGETIYINADGSINPSTAPIYTADNITYTVTNNITPATDGIVIERDNIILNGANFTVQGNGNGKGIDLSNRNNVTIENTNIMNFLYGIHLGHSSNNTIAVNSITNNGDGFLLDSSSNNSVNGNNITSNGFGIWLDNSSYNGISGNAVTANSNDGIHLHSSTYNSISGNNITANSYEGISLQFYANYNSISGNDITANGYDGIGLYSSSSNTIFHNNFVNNILQVYSNVGDKMNVWDNGYPSGGNYWSDYNGSDCYSGLYQNITGSDGIGDTPYVIDSNNIDHYPIANPAVVVPPPKLVGDLNGDGEVSLQDLQLLAQAYRSKPGDPNWNPNADLAAPYGIISLTDLVTLAMHYGMSVNAFADKVLLVTSMGNITIQLFNDMPITVGNFKNLVNSGAYNGTIFYRVHPGFVIQGGDLTSKGINWPTIPDELPNKHSNLRGTVAMAKTSLPNSATSQFYINLNDTNAAYLDSTYSVFGTVIAGMDIVDAISNVPFTPNTLLPQPDGQPLTNVTLIVAQFTN